MKPTGWSEYRQTHSSGLCEKQSSCELSVSAEQCTARRVSAQSEHLLISRDFLKNTNICSK